MRFKCISNPTTALPAVLAALCSATLISSAYAEQPRQSVPVDSTRVEDLANTGGQDGVNIVQNFETFTLGAGCNQNGWTGFCAAGVGFLIEDVSGTHPTFGIRTAKHQSDGSAVTGFEIVSPINATMETGIVAADIKISDSASLYQFVPVNTVAAFFNTRVNFNVNGTIEALQISGVPPCTTGVFAPTSATWTANTVMRIAVQVPGDGTLKIYKNGTQIFNGHDIAAFCAAAGTAQGINQVRIFAANAAGAATNLLLDNINDSFGNACASALPLCPTDVANNDGLTNVSDLLAVIATFGQNGNPNGPRPQGDCAPLPNGNCIVDVQDLLAVIGAFGPCPQPTGACCLPNGSCAQNVTSANCTGQGGTYQGNGSTTCPGCAPAPANDNCQGAIALGAGSHNVSNAGATTSPQPGLACGGGGAANTTRDVWYTHTASCNGNITISTCTAAGTLTDSLLGVYSGTCPDNLAIVACSDDDCPTSGSLQSSVTFLATQGTTYTIRLASWGTVAGNSGTSTLVIGACTPLNNDFCNEAAAINIPSTTNGSILGATADNAATCNGVAMSKARWYKVVGNGMNLTASLCNSPFELWDSRLSVYCGSSCDNLFCVTAADDGCGVHSQVSWCSALGQTYYIAVHTPDLVSSPEGNYVLQIVSGLACNNPIPCGPPNDLCANATDVTANIGGAPVNGDTVGATPVSVAAGPDTELPAGSPTCHWAAQPQSTYGTLWYRFTAPASGRIDINVCGSTGSLVDTVIALYSGNCGSLVEVACGEDECGGPTWFSRITALNLVGGQQYRLMVGNAGATANDVSVPGTFSFVLTEPPAPGCPPTLPATGCTNQIAGNGPFDPAATGANGTRPSAGWANGELGIMEDVVFCNAGGGTINQLRFQFLDQIAAGTGTLSTYNQIRVRVYALNGSAITSLNPVGAVPLFSQDFTVGTNATKALCGTIGFGLDAECWVLTVPNWHLATGNYGVFVSFPQLTNAAAPSVFLATGSPPTCAGCQPNDSSPQQAHVWGLNAGAPVNGASGQHSSYCAGGTVP